MQEIVPPAFQCLCHVRDLQWPRSISATPVIADEKVPAVMLVVPERVFDGASAGGAVVLVEYDSDGLAGAEDGFGAFRLGSRR